MKKPIQVFLRHCYHSKLQDLPDSKRPSWFNKYKVFQNFKNTIDSQLIDYTIVYDEFYGSIEKTFLRSEKNVNIVRCGLENDSFLETLDIVKSKNFDDETIIYFLEDDYVHRFGWGKVLLEGFEIGTSYVTLYDLDFYIGKGYLTELFLTSSSHWRVVPATTNTFACKYKTLIEDFDIHRKHSMEGVRYSNGDRMHSDDHAKFIELGKNKKYIASPIPGWSTHCDRYVSPIIDWKKVLNESNCDNQSKYLNNIGLYT